MTDKWPENTTKLVGEGLAMSCREKEERRERKESLIAWLQIKLMSNKYLDDIDPQKLLFANHN